MSHDRQIGPAGSPGEGAIDLAPTTPRQVSNEPTLGLGSVAEALDPRSLSSGARLQPGEVLAERFTIVRFVARRPYDPTGTARPSSPM